MYLIKQRIRAHLFVNFALYKYLIIIIITSVITINYSSDASSIGTIIYDNNLHNDCDQCNTPWGKTCHRSTYYIDYFIII